MSAGVLPLPGSDTGPCEGSCQHRDCASTRKNACSSCRFCLKEIGFETRFYADPELPDEFVHALCLVEACDCMDCSIAGEPTH